jgi:hypothetical protein
MNHEHTQLLQTLERRFERHPRRHEGLAWADVRARLAARPKAMRAVQAMEASGGEPDVVGPADASGRLRFVDCSTESPTGRRSVCYDEEARRSRKEHAPASSALELAASMGIGILSEDEYRELQRYGEFDHKTSSWILTPPEVRALGGALFGDRRYGRVFAYHNGAQSYYAARGFRGALWV